MTNAQYLVAVTHGNRTASHWFRGNGSLTHPGDTEADTALWAAREYYWEADKIELALRNGAPITR